MYPYLLLAVAAAGCGSGAERPALAPPAKPRTIELGWVERASAARFVFRVERFIVEERGWRARVAVTNRSPYPHALFGGSVALVVLETSSPRELSRLTKGLRRPPPSIPADGFAPAAPHILGPGRSWTAEVRGTVVLRAGSVVRLLFGPYRRSIGVADPKTDVLWVTDRSLRL